MTDQRHGHDTPKAQDTLLEIGHVAIRLRKSSDTVRRYIRDGFLPAIKLPGGSYLVRESALHEFLRSLEL